MFDTNDKALPFTLRNVQHVDGDSAAHALSNWTNNLKEPKIFPAAPSELSHI